MLERQISIIASVMDKVLTMIFQVCRVRATQESRHASGLELETFINDLELISFFNTIDKNLDLVSLGLGIMKSKGKV